jgi:hypothetical protein
VRKLTPQFSIGQLFEGVYAKTPCGIGLVGTVIPERIVASSIEAACSWKDAEYAKTGKGYVGDLCMQGPIDPLMARAIEYILDN